MILPRPEPYLPLIGDVDLVGRVGTQIQRAQLILHAAERRGAHEGEAAVEFSGITGAKMLAMFGSAAVARLSSMLCHSICAPVSSVWPMPPVRISRPVRTGTWVVVVVGLLAELPALSW